MGMVVRSNIMALNANRQLGLNNSQVSKSLEKLSSGYKINRAGDDASGLAISEKMKAQIKGLETASANSQDGISLVQTAEGALTEVHDMLNRMVELAGKAANGTIDNETDRAALQKEMNALLDEIDRIADSTDFNGIKLLNGDLAGQIDATFTEDNTTTLDSIGITAGSLDLSKADPTLTGDLKIKYDSTGGKVVATANGKTYEAAWNTTDTGALTLKNTAGEDSITINVKDANTLKSKTTDQKVGTLCNSGIDLLVLGGLVTVAVIILELDACFGKRIIQCSTHAGDVCITVGVIEYSYIQLSLSSAALSARYEAEHHNADQQ